MDMYSDSTDRSPGEYVRFALGFIGFLVAASGMVLGASLLALIGVMVLLLVVASFQSSGEE
jgi:hypothetical protein